MYLQTRILYHLYCVLYQVFPFPLYAFPQESLFMSFFFFFECLIVNVTVMGYV